MIACAAPASARRRFLSLQIDERAPAWTDDALAACKDYADTAAVVAGLDLVITVDASIAHLAGAIGVPTWVILPEQNVDWRWGSEGEATPWYASMRLLRRAGIAAAVQRLDEWCRTRGLEARQDT